MKTGGQHFQLQPTTTTPQKPLVDQTVDEPAWSIPACSISSTLPKFEDLNLIKGDQAIEMSGIVKSHVPVLKHAALRHQAILMFRPVNQWSTSLLDGRATAKGMHIKGKSSDWGPMAGFIPADQALSRKWDDPDAITSSNQANQKTLVEHADKVSKMPLELDANRLSELSDVFGLIELPLSLTRKDVIKYDENSPQHFPIQLGSKNDDKCGVIEKQRSKFEFRLELRENNKYLIHYKAPHEDASHWRKVEVLCDAPKADINHATGKPQPITADYDAFAFLPKIEAMDIGSAKSVKALEESLRQSRFATSDTSTPRTSSSGDSFFRVVQAARDVLLAQDDRRSFTEGIGRERKSDSEIRNTINNWIRATGYPGEQIVLHASEVDNALSPEQDENIFAVMPDGNVYITQSWDQVQAFMYIADHQGYAVYGNRNYNIPAGNTVVYHNQLEFEGVKGTPGKTIPWNPFQAYLREIDAAPSQKTSESK